MKKVFVTIVLLTSFASQLSAGKFGVTVRMPGKDVLQKKLNRLEMSDFEKTWIVDQLADQFELSKGVAAVLDIYMRGEYFFERLKERGLPVPQQETPICSMRKSAILAVLLEDEPAALEDLKDYGIYKPSE